MKRILATVAVLVVGMSVGVWWKSGTLPNDPPSQSQTIVPLPVQPVQNERDALQKTKQLQGEIDKDSGITETLLAEQDNQTASEFLKLCDHSIESREFLIAELRGEHPELQSPFKEHLIRHLNSENDLFRAKRQFYQRTIDYTKWSSSVSIEDYTAQVPSYVTQRVERMQLGLMDFDREAKRWKQRIS
jgi:hypothetical protein